MGNNASSPDFARLEAEQDPVLRRAKVLDAANAGNVGAMCKLGNMHATGEGGARDLAQAVVCYYQAAKGGAVEAQVKLAHMKASGIGCAVDLSEAILWFEKAAGQGDSTALASLGLMYHTGKGVSVDLDKARLLYKRAADQGNPAAQTGLGRMLQRGEGGPLNFEQARLWYQKAASQDHADAEAALGELLYFGIGCTADHAVAFRHFEKAANSGSMTGEYMLGEMLLKGDGCTTDAVKAAHYYRGAAQQGHMDAMLGLGGLLHSEPEVRDIAQAKMWLEKAANRGSAAAQVQLGILLIQEDQQNVHPGSPTDVADQAQYIEQSNDITNKAKKLFDKAGEKGNGQALLQLGLLHYSKAAQDPAEMAVAFTYFQKGAALEDSNCMVHIGLMYERGVNGPVNHAMARKWFKQAALQGNPEAVDILTKSHQRASGIMGCMRSFDDGSLC